MVKAANATGISTMIVPIVRSQISRLVCVSIDYPTPRDTDRSRPTREKRQYRRAARFPGASRRPVWQSVQKSRVLHKTIDLEVAQVILCRIDVQKWRRKWRFWVTREYRQTGSR